jgi:hypothetical protein
MTESQQIAELECNNALLRMELAQAREVVEVAADAFASLQKQLAALQDAARLTAALIRDGSAKR